MVVVLPTIIHLQNTDIKPEISHHIENDNFWHLVLQVWIQYLVPVHTNNIIYFLVWSDNPVKLETSLTVILAPLLSVLCTNEFGIPIWIWVIFFLTDPTAWAILIFLILAWVSSYRFGTACVTLFLNGHIKDKKIIVWRKFCLVSSPFCLSGSWFA